MKETLFALAKWAAVLAAVISLAVMFGGNTDTSILHAQQHFAGFLCNGHFHAAAGVVVLNGIVAKVVNDLVQ